ncbi:MAG: reverse transcriptase domain-containing protein [Hyphomonas sp.]|jgi:retron-type reverse transcriptase|nr:reverse transcriptase domain-containing protein [Hyphomonas sp.]
MNALSRLFSQNIIKEYWATNKSKFPRRTTPGVDGVSRDEFDATIELEAKIISKSISDGEYRFQKLRPIAIPKDKDRIRLINVPTIRDRLVQRMALSFLVEEYGEKWKIPNSFSSMGGDDEGVQKTLRIVGRSVTQNDYLIKADLSSYFDTINRDLMARIVRKQIRHRSFHSLIASAIKCETSTRTARDRAVFQKAGLVKNKGIRQGMPLSPVLAFLFLANEDRSVSGGFFRYVDDLLFIGSSKADVLSAFESYRLAVESRGLKVHPLSTGNDGRKTQLIGPSENFTFLGITVCRRSNETVFQIPKKSKQRIEEDLIASTVLDMKNPKHQKSWILSASNRTTNLVRNYKSAYGYCEDWPDFERQLKAIQLNMCRRIARQLSEVEKSKNVEVLLRVFGI